MIHVMCVWSVTVIVIITDWGNTVMCLFLGDEINV